MFSGVRALGISAIQRTSFLQWIIISDRVKNTPIGSKGWLKKVAFIHILVVWWAGQITGTLSVVVADHVLPKIKNLTFLGQQHSMVTALLHCGIGAFRHPLTSLCYIIWNGRHKFLYCGRIFSADVRWQAVLRLMIRALPNSITVVSASPSGQEAITSFPFRFMKVINEFWSEYCRAYGTIRRSADTI